MPKLESKTLRTNMGGVSRRGVAHAAMNVITNLQDFPPQVQITAAALVFERMCAKAGIRPAEALQIGNNVFTDGERVHPEFKAVDSFLEFQLFRNV